MTSLVPAVLAALAIALYFYTRQTARSIRRKRARCTHSSAPLVLQPAARGPRTRRGI